MGDARTVATIGVKRRLIGAAFAIGGVVTAATQSPANAQSDYQTINGTQVFTVVDQQAGIATFSNSCGSQTLTQRQLQQGAIPSNIIPCPRTGGSAAAYVPSVPSGGNNNLAIGLGVFNGALGLAKALESAPSNGGGGAAYAPSATDDGATGSINAARDARHALFSRALSLYDQAAAENQSKNFCKAAQNFQNAASAFSKAGDSKRANDAAFQASMTAADCEEEKYVYYCVDEDNVYAGGWIPARPGEGCHGGKIDVKAPKGATNSEIRKILRKRLQEQLAKGGGGAEPGATTGAGQAGAPGQTDSQLENAALDDASNAEPEADAPEHERALRGDVGPAPRPKRSGATASAANDENPLDHYLASKNNGYSNAGQFDPQVPNTEGLTPAEHAVRDASE
ncbi:MAG: hypothetical protein ACT4OU_02825 [Hyphomicrobium sp.]